MNKALKNGLIIAAFTVLLTSTIGGFFHVTSWMRNVDTRLARIEATLNITNNKASYAP